MSWTYSGDPASTTRDAVRFMVGDTDTTEQLITDEEIAYLVTTHGSTNRVASEAARAIAAKFARLMSRSVGGLSANFSAKYSQYLALANDLLGKDETVPVSPYISGYGVSAKAAVEEDTDREPTFAKKGQHDNYDSGSSTPTGYRSGA